MSWRKEYDKCPNRNQHKNSEFFLVAFRGPDMLCFAVLGLVGTNSYTVPHAAGGAAKKKTP